MRSLTIWNGRWRGGVMGIIARLFRSFAAVLSILLVVVGQVHACQEQFRLPDGASCQTCPKLKHLPGDPLGSGLGTQHGDCHDCCALVACSSPQSGAKAAVPSSVHFDFAMPEVPCLLEFPTAPVAAGPIELIETHLAHGPPSAASSRAPPFCLR